MRVAVVGAGLSGATIAHVLAEAGHGVDLFEARDHVAGNCFTYRHHGVIVHKYGPHIWHTNDRDVDQFFRQFGPMLPYSLRMKAVVAGRHMSFPINLLTLTEFFGRGFSGPEEARQYVARQTRDYGHPDKFDGFMHRTIGPALYEAFYESYTWKAWGVSPSSLPASIAQRIPVRYDFDDRAHNHAIQAMPMYGYTPMVHQMLNSGKISLHLGEKVLCPDDTSGWDHVFFTGSPDLWFRFKCGRLPYRTVTFREEVGKGSMLGCAVVGYCDHSVPEVRAVEHKYFDQTPNGSEMSVVSRLHLSDAGPEDEPYYPFPDAPAAMLYRQEFERVARDVTFVGRLGTYQYLNMDQSIALARAAALRYVEDRK